MSCIIFHKWSKWKTIKDCDITENGKTKGTYILQERRCEKCGKVRRNEIKTYIW